MWKTMLTLQIEWDLLIEAFPFGLFQRWPCCTKGKIKANGAEEKTRSRWEKNLKFPSHWDSNRDWYESDWIAFAALIYVWQFVVNTCQQIFFRDMQISRAAFIGIDCMQRMRVRCTNVCLCVCVRVTCEQINQSNPAPVGYVSYVVYYAW